ncbi:BQ5605_C011g06615 [Microbotryum silenes-dioicae]|uniref:BQ5605_C011g06615 protein n=1 Tax=Microbotryum silenes-dioicae TaxID=796604 RepID=A0A2X0MAM9_9BASI|nr:BQ5605_C011g06615 [Microbotryum silenes-dioicae]
MSSPNGGLAKVPTTPISIMPELDPETEELWSSRALLLVRSVFVLLSMPDLRLVPISPPPAPAPAQVLLLLILSFWVSYYLKIRRIRSIHETIVAMFAGMCVGLLVRLAPGNVIQTMISFKSTILLNVLLPPIILNSGYQLKQENFFRNFGVIITFAFAGTFISAVVLGVIVYIYSLLGLEGLSLNIIECLQFGSTLSATDPVTILAIFNALHVDPKLYSVIFGESILNDAVAIVMFETLSQFHGEKIHVLSFFHGVGIFLLTFCVSMLLGVVFGLACSLMLKHSELGRYTEIESCLVFLIAYTSYFFSNAVTMSGEFLRIRLITSLAMQAESVIHAAGIVSLLFCGITLKHYAYHNMSHRTQRTSRYMFGSLAQLSENFIFIYLGLSLFTQTQLVYKPMFILVTAVRAVSRVPITSRRRGLTLVACMLTQFAVCIARYCAVFPISKGINVFFKARGNRADELPHSYQMMLFWAGLRGAVGVALAEGMKGPNAIALRTTVLVSVVLTVVVFGGTIGRMIEILGIRTGVEDDDPESSDDEGGAGYAITNNGEGDIEGTRSAAGWNKAAGLATHKARRSLPNSRKFGGNGHAGRNEEEEGVVSAMDSPYSDRMALKSVVSTTPPSSVPKMGTLHPHGSFKGPSSPSHSSRDSGSDSEGDVLPSVSKAGTGAAATAGEGDNTRVWRDGQWFTVLDERYLLPVFSNATASRRQATKKAILREKRKSLVTLEGMDDYIEEGNGSPSQPGSPYLVSPSARSGGPLDKLRHQAPTDFTGSFSDILSSLVSPGSATFPVNQKRRASFSEAEGNEAEFYQGQSTYHSTITLGTTSSSRTSAPIRPRVTGSLSGASISEPSSMTATGRAPSPANGGGGTGACVPFFEGCEGYER